MLRYREEADGSIKVTAKRILRGHLRPTFISTMTIVSRYEASCGTEPAWSATPADPRPSKTFKNFYDAVSYVVSGPRPYE